MAAIAAYDVIVLGLGGMGSAACLAARRRGARVLGIEQFGRAHDRGSSHGETRLIRQAYFEHADYVPLLKLAYRLWDRLGEELGRILFHRRGLVIHGSDPRNGASPILEGIRQAARQHSIAIEEFASRSQPSCWPCFRLPKDFIGIYEPEAGYLEVEACVRAHLELAERLGAELRFDEPVLSWDASAREARVKTAQGEYSARTLIITAGAWSSALLKSADVQVQAHRNLLFWFGAESDAYRKPEAPCFAFHLPYGFFYGFPDLGAGVKLAHHAPGEPVSDPARVDRGLRDADLAPVERCRSEVMPELRAGPLKHAACLYEMSRDEHFILDHAPGYENVVFGAGFSGHGFKFASAIGDILAELALEGRTSQPIEFLRLARLVSPPPQPTHPKR